MNTSSPDHLTPDQTLEEWIRRHGRAPEAKVEQQPPQFAVGQLPEIGDIGVTIRDAALLLGEKPAPVHELVLSGELPAVRHPAGHLVIAVKDVLKLAARDSNPIRVLLTVEGDTTAAA